MGQEVMGMQVAELRQRLGARLQALATEKDPQVVSTILEYARATLIALAPLDDDTEVSPEELTLGVDTVAQIFSAPSEWLKQMIEWCDIDVMQISGGEHALKLSDVTDWIMASLEQRAALVPPLRPGGRLEFRRRPSGQRWPVLIYEAPQANKEGISQR